jgi:5-methylcytosine-specific restriction protein A
MPKAPPILKRKLPRKTWTNPTKRIGGRRRQHERRLLLTDHPLCAECEKHGRVTEATIRDHIRALALGGTDTRDNTQPLCKPCHDEKTKRESILGATRARGG